MLSDPGTHLTQQNQDVQPYPILYFQLIDYFLQFYCKYMPFRCDVRFEKGEKKFGKRRVRTQKARALTSTRLKQASFFRVDYPNHTLVGGVRVNSICQQGGLFALSVNRHSENIHSILK